MKFRYAFLYLIYKRRNNSNNFRQSMIKRINISKSTKKQNPGISNKSKSKIFKLFWRNSEKKHQVLELTNLTPGMTWRRNKLRKLGSFLEKYLNQVAPLFPTFGTKNLLHQVAEVVLGPHNHVPVLPLLLGTSRTLGVKRIKEKPPTVGKIILDSLMHFI